MLFDLEDYATSMRAVTDRLRFLNNTFNLGLSLPKANGSEGHFIPTADLILEIKQVLKTKQQIGLYGGPEGNDALSGVFDYTDFWATANATKDAAISAVKTYHLSNRRTASSFNEIKTQNTALNEFLDANIALAEKYNRFWFSFCSFKFYGKGFVEGDILSEELHVNSSNGYFGGPVKFTILTQAIYDEYFAALTNFMQKIKAIMVLNGLEA